MGVILRTAGANRTKAEVKRDFEYLLRLWENVRELTLRSTAPKLVYEEGSLIKRSIRDLYSREIDQVVVAGDDAYREAKDFMRMLMPSHARNVQLYREDTPIFARNGVEAQLDAMFSPQVTLRSGGYIVINQTEALVSIDVNSGRSTREHSIEDTALNTNLEAAEEIARQLRLRDLAGLIVIDFIDMEEKRNNRSVERKLKDCLRADRARIQVGRISHFGLMEMSRQRIRTGVLESSTVSCPHCRGTGQVRSISSLSLQILRALEDQLLRNSGHHLHVRTRPEVALYVLNQKRKHLAQLEARFGLTITISGEAPESGAGFAVERGAPVEERPERPERISAIALPELPDEPELECRRSRPRKRSARKRASRRAPSGGAAGAVGAAARERRGSPRSRRGAPGTLQRRRRRGDRGRRRRPRSRRSASVRAALRGPRTRTARMHAAAVAAGAAGAGAAGAARPGEYAGNGRPPARRRRRGRIRFERRGVRACVGCLAGGAARRFPRCRSARQRRSGDDLGRICAGAERGHASAAEQPTGDGHAEEVAALEARRCRGGATDRHADAPSGWKRRLPRSRLRVPAARRRSLRSLRRPPPPEPVEDNRPKRSGWWNRKSFF